MPLTVRTNGSSSSNIITSSWFNDFRDLLTGAMQDQEVSIRNVLILQAISAAPSSAATGAVVTGTGLGIGAYSYVYTYANADGETTISPVVSVTTTSGNQKVNLSAISVGPTGTTKRKVYRTIVGGGTAYKLLTTLNDNTTTTYTDTTADGSLGAAPPASPSFGGALIIKDQAGAVKFQINNDGSFSAGGSTGFGNTTISGTLTVSGTTTLNGLVLAPLGRFGKTTSGDIIDANGSTTFIKGGAVFIQVPNGTTVAQFLGSGLSLPGAGILNVNGGTLRSVSQLQFNDTASTISKFHTFSGTGNVTVNHTNNGAPNWLQITTSTGGASSQTVGIYNVTSTQVSVQTGAGLAWLGICGNT